MQNARLDEAQAGIKYARLDEAQAGRNINNLRYADDTTFMAENEQEQEPLDESESKSEKVGLKLTFKKLRSWHLVLSLYGK